MGNKNGGGGDFDLLLNTISNTLASGILPYLLFACLHLGMFLSGEKKQLPKFIFRSILVSPWGKCLLQPLEGFGQFIDNENT